MTLFVYLFFLGLPHLRWNGKFFAKKADELRLEFCMENLYLLSGALNTSYSATPKTMLIKHFMSRDPMENFLRR